MSELQEKLDEFYMNYDTAEYLKQDNDVKTIVELFKNELEYPEKLTAALLKFKKSYLKSVVMRIKVKMNKVEPDALKTDIMKYNSDLEPVLDKLLTSKFKEEYEKVSQPEESPVQVVENNEVKEVDNYVKEVDNEVEEVDNEVEEEVDPVTNFLDTHITETGDEDDFIKVTAIYEALKSYYSDNEYEDIMTKSEFKKHLIKEWGKSNNSGYSGYQLSTDE